ncbi:MAG: lytic transglycosylase domain-containing protein, partial [Oscillospiraceae bacterium]
LLVVILLFGAFAIFVFPVLQNEGPKLLYPKKYTSIVEKEARKNDLDPNLVYAVIKTESDFDPNATSYADAKGLMQMTDETFSWMQTVLNEEQNSEKLYEPATNIRYGCALLHLLLQEYQNTDVALAAYNAGMGNVDAWLVDPEFSQDGETLSYIPFEETDNYVERINVALKNYKEIYS